MRTQGKKTVFGFLFFILLFVLFSGIFCVYLAPKPEKNEPVSASSLPVIVIDAGHGGVDGGAVGADGTLEKELNLEIAGKLKFLFETAGYQVVMTRSEDVMLSTADGNGSAKMRDLKRRLEIASAYSESLTVSVHCNKFPDGRCRGLQVYYSDDPTAKAVAESVQSEVVTLLQNDNHRAVKKTDSSVYLLYRAKTPSVLVECGFLSNEEERENLKNEEYQKKLALSVFSGIIKASDGTEEK